MDRPPQRAEPPASVSTSGFKRMASERDDEAKRRAVSDGKSTENMPRPMRPAPRGSAFFEPETDEKRLAQRQKQIDFGKNTLGYQRYADSMPKATRRRGDPRTPDKFKKQPKRSWDREIIRWRRMLHQWDPAGTLAPQEPGNTGGEADEAEALPEDVAESLPEELPEDLGAAEANL